MKIWRVLKRVSVKNLSKLVGYLFQYPMFANPTIKATRQTMKIATEHYGRKHYQNGPANAFRHALWTYSIAKNCAERSENKKKCSDWAKTITDWHENAFRNRQLARIMDFHNNAVGRYLFLKYPTEDFSLILKKLKKMTEASVLINTATDLNPLKNQLVHIKDDH